MLGLFGISFSGTVISEFCFVSSCCDEHKAPNWKKQMIARITKVFENNFFICYLPPQIYNYIL